MLLAIDVGNSNITLGLYDGPAPGPRWRLATVHNRTADEYGMLLDDLLEHAGFEVDAVDAVVMASVVPPLTGVLEEAAKRYLGRAPLVVDAGVKTGVRIRYDDPKQVGADRVVDAAAIRHLYGGPACCVDFGTATTFDAISAEGDYLGGAIAPGIGIAADALFQRAAKLPRVDLVRPPVRDREEHRAFHPVGTAVRVREPRGRDGGALPEGARTGDESRRHGRPRRDGREGDDGHRRRGAVADAGRPAPRPRDERGRLMDAIPVLRGKRILLGVSGSIAAYKAADLASLLTQAGAHVDAILTAAAARFVTPLTFQSLTGRPAHADLWSAEAHVLHVGLAEGADLLLVAPATADILAKLAHGLADDLLTVTALAARCPLLVAPAMDAGMFEHPAVQANLATLRARGATVIGPAEGRMASGLAGRGRMLEPEEILGHVRRAAGRNGPLAGRRVVVTAGGTEEPVDPVRVLANRSSGKQGFALARGRSRPGRGR